MSDNEDTSELPQSTTFGALGLLMNNPLATDLSKKKFFVFNFF